MQNELFQTGSRFGDGLPSKISIAISTSYEEPGRELGLTRIL